jgi:hypothetical protein
MTGDRDAPPALQPAITLDHFTSSDGVRVRPSKAMIARGVAALHAATEHRSTKRDPRAAVEAILLAALNP